MNFKTTKLLAPIATVPDEIPDDSEYDINIIIVKDGKYVCRSVVKKNVEYKNASYKEKMFFLKRSAMYCPASSITTSVRKPDVSENTGSIWIPNSRLSSGTAMVWVNMP